MLLLGVILWTMVCLVFCIGIASALDFDFIGCTCGLVMFVLLVILPWLYYVDSRSEDLVTLKKNAWQCLGSHESTTTTFIQSGSTQIPVNTTVQVCDVYGRK
jgi:hypothetical protein